MVPILGDIFFSSRKLGDIICDGLYLERGPSEGAPAPHNENQRTLRNSWRLIELAHGHVGYEYLAGVHE
jgi:hypothetical protein